MPITFSDSWAQGCNRAVEQLGQHWAQVSKRVGRTEQDCRDRYLNHLAGSHVRASGKPIPASTELKSGTKFTPHAGKWSKEEEDQLKQVVGELSRQQGISIDKNHVWSKVSELMEGKRSRQQCAQKWFVTRNIW